MAFRRCFSDPERRQAGAWQPVFRAEGPSWVVLDLEPGRFRLHIPRVVDRGGQRVETRGWRRPFDVEPNAITHVDAILGSRGRKIFGIVGKVALFAGALAVDEWIDEDPVPYDPYCSLDSLTATDVALDIAVDDGPPGGWTPAPLSHFPRAGAVVAGAGLEVAVALSAPRPEAPSEPYAIVVRTRDGGRVPGRVAYDDATWQVTWTPDGALPTGEELAVYVGLPGANDWLGTDLGGLILFTFRTAPVDG